MQTFARDEKKEKSINKINLIITRKLWAYLLDGAFGKEIRLLIVRIIMIFGRLKRLLWAAEREKVIWISINMIMHDYLWHIASEARSKPSNWVASHSEQMERMIIAMRHVERVKKRFLFKKLHAINFNGNQLILINPRMLFGRVIYGSTSSVSLRKQPCHRSQLFFRCFRFTLFFFSFN